MKKEQKNHRSLAFVAWMGSLLMLPMHGFYLSVSAPKAIAQQQASQLSQEQLQNLAKSITVRIISGNRGGSGVLLKKQGALFTVLASKHVLEASKPHLIQTADSQNHQGEVVKGVNFGNRDLVLLQFRANANYPVATFGQSILKEGDEVFAAGFPFKDSPSDARQFDFRSGRVSILLEKKLQGGYGIGYTSYVEKGMSGGPLLNIQGQLVGINGIQIQPLWGNPYIYEDGTQPSDTLRQQMKSSSWGVPIQILAQLAPQFVPVETVQQSRTSRITTSAVPVPRLTNRVNSVAKEITVLINSITDKGSGAIIANQGNTYYVLTARHITHNKEQITVSTPDGKEYSVDISKVKTWDGIDLALLQFTSNEKYQVATLGNYGLDIEDQVIFVSGFPKSKQANVKLSREFNAGFLLGWSRATNSAMDDRSFSSGYELVYTNITTEGMSGGPVLDVEGRLIGIHTAAEAVKGEKLSPIPEKTPQKPKLELGYSLGIPIRTLLAKITQENTQLNFTQKSSPPSSLTTSQQDEIVRASLNLKEPKSSADAIEWLNFGNKLWRLRRYEDAEKAFEKAIKLKRNFYEAWYAHGMALMRQEKYKQAIASFKTAINYNQKSDQAWRQLGDAFGYSGEYEEARKAFLKAIELRPDDFILYNWLAKALNLLGRYPEALEAGNTSIEINPKSSQNYIQRSQIRQNLSDDSGAIDDINEALKLQPDLARAYQHRGYLRFLQQDYTGALTDFDKAIDLRPKWVGAYVDRGGFYARMRNRQKFDEDFNQALRLKPDSAVIYMARGDGYFILGETQKAIDDYKQAIRLAPQFAYRFYMERGSVRSQNKDYVGAINDYTEALNFRPNYVLAYVRRGYAYAKEGKRQESIRDFEKALSLQPQNAWVYINRGDARFILKDSQGGIEDYEKAINLTPNLAYLFYAKRANARFEQKDYEGAIQDYSQAIKLKPKNALFYHQRALARSRREYYNEAIDDFDVAIKLKPNYGEAYGNRGLAHARLKNKQKAISDLQKAAQIFQNLNDTKSYELAQSKIRELQKQ